MAEDKKNQASDQEEKKDQIPVPEDTIKLGIKETKEALDFIVALGNGFGAAYEDRKFNLSEITLFFPAIMKFIPAFEGITQIPDELKDLDPEEAKELIDYVKEEFDIPQDKAEEFVEKAIRAAFYLWVFLKDFFIKEE